MQKMADANRTPTPQPGLSLPTQFLMLAKQIQFSENAEGAPPGGATVTYDPNGVVARIAATIPLERVQQPDGSEILRPVNFLK